MKGHVTKRFLEAQDGNNRAYWTFLVTSRWLGLRLDALCICLFAVSAIAAAGSRRAPLDPGLVGLALTQLITLISGFQWYVLTCTCVSSQQQSCATFVPCCVQDGAPERRAGEPLRVCRARRGVRVTARRGRRRGPSGAAGHGRALLLWRESKECLCECHPSSGGTCPE